ncbi:MAG: hypothetical protein OEV89_07385 [Desulfobulbaceae bacterium]|nr:hypothetical protein [Desulfobulbaceae bacterium]HIJ90575.1 hypothetical protein [Deltaproteobacteria bacterium]
MEGDLRYKVEHVGDLFVESLEEFGRAIKRRFSFCGNIGTFRGVAITRDIHKLERTKMQVVYRVGERVLEIRREDPALFNADQPMTAIFSELDTIEGNMDTLIKEREQRLDRIRGKIEATKVEVEVAADLGDAMPAMA